MQIRRALARDIPEMHRIRTSVRENELSDPGSVQPHNYESLLDGEGRGWVVETDAGLAGFAIADVSRANVWALFVHPAFEARGAGRMLHDAMLDWLFSQDLDRVWLSTSPGTRAERFYRAAGWQHAGHEANGEARYEMSRDRWRSR